MNTSGTASLNTKLSVEEKEQFVETSESLGMTPSAAIRVFVRMFNEHQGFPFAIRKGYPMSEEERREIALLDKAIDDGTVKAYSSFSEILQEVDSEIAVENTGSHA